ncbi:MAG: AAA family ATPase, partial [Candidatus Diapherotrites archaeon]|nr:AAA family ATPase [Candidatus Diapherotrites archaeon]
MTRIDSLKLRNFKSFKKADIPLAPGVTAAIGANGSGKSNLVDALMFVLGINSLKTIRADRLTDLVCKTSDDNKARVTIKLKNEKQNILTRTIDASGKSVYKIEGKRTTRTELHNLLNTMGITPGGHNVVMQGDIEKIIEMTPRSRRTIIDELAGIAEYEGKKQDAIKQLDKVEEKIKEWSIVKGERQEYLDNLKLDRDSAIEYNDLTSEVKNIKGTVLNSEISRVQKDYDKNKILLDSSDAKIKDYEEKINEIDTELRGWDVKLKAINREILESGGRGQTALGQAIESLRTELELKKEQVANRREQIDKNKIELQELNQRLREITNELQNKDAELKEVEIKT